VAEYTDFTPAQRTAIVQAGWKNSQIALILDDADVYAFISSVVDGHESVIDPDDLGSLMSVQSLDLLDVGRDRLVLRQQWCH
jgi:hypothetical protein